MHRLPLEKGLWHCLYGNACHRGLFTFLLIKISCWVKTEDMTNRNSVRTISYLKKKDQRLGFILVNFPHFLQNLWSKLCLLDLNRKLEFFSKYIMIEIWRKEFYLDCFEMFHNPAKLQYHIISRNPDNSSSYSL